MGRRKVSVLTTGRVARLGVKESDAVGAGLSAGSSEVYQGRRGGPVSAVLLPRL